MPRNYPDTVTEVLEDGKKYRPAALAAVRKLARSKPWQGGAEERFQKMDTCLRELARAYRMRKPGLNVAPGNTDCYSPSEHVIYLQPKMSVVTFLHEFAHSRGWPDERKVCNWSINLFRRCFPRSYAACEHSGHMLLKGQRALESRPRRRVRVRVVDRPALPAPEVQS